MKQEFHHVLNTIRASRAQGRALREEAMLLLNCLDCYDWSGIYRLEDGALHLDAFVGAPTDHTRIPIGVGVCGTAVAEGRNLMVDDVHKLDNYLACSLNTRAEIVVLIWRGGQVIAQIDVDSHTVSAFSTEDESFLEELAAILALRWDD